MTNPGYRHQRLLTDSLIYRPSGGFIREHASFRSWFRLQVSAFAPLETFLNPNYAPYFSQSKRQ